MLKSVLDLIRTVESEGIKNYANLPWAVCAQKSLLLQWRKNESNIAEERESERDKKQQSVLRKAPVCAFENMLKSFMYIKNYKRIIIILAFFLLYISVYLIHNAYGPLCIIKSNSSSGDKGNINKGDTEVLKLYKASNSNLFVSNVHSNLSICSTIFGCGSVCDVGYASRCHTKKWKKIRRNHVSNHDYFEMAAFYYTFTWINLWFKIS